MLRDSLCGRKSGLGGTCWRAAMAACLRAYRSGRAAGARFFKNKFYLSVKKVEYADKKCWKI
jgi:hypothetical protein